MSTSDAVDPSKIRLKMTVRDLSPIVTGFQHALEKLSLTREEREIIKRLEKTHRGKLEEAKEQLKIISNKRRPKKNERVQKAGFEPLKKVPVSYKSKSPVKSERVKPLTLKKLNQLKKKKKENEVNDMHKKSGFNKRIKIVQGGSPSLGKRS